MRALSLRCASLLAHPVGREKCNPFLDIISAIVLKFIDLCEKHSFGGIPWVYFVCCSAGAFQRITPMRRESKRRIPTMYFYWAYSRFHHHGTPESFLDVPNPR